MSFLNKLHKPNIEKLQANCDIPGLIEALNYRIADDDLDASLVRQKAAAALGEIGDVRAVGPLINALSGKDWEVRDFAAKALGQIGDGRALEPLLAALKDRDHIVGEAAAQALDRLSWQPTTDETSATYWCLKRNWQKCAEIGAPAASVLVAAVNGRDKEIGREALNALGKISDARAVELLLALLNDNNPNLRQAAVKALGQIGAPAVEGLLARLTGRDRVALQTVVEVIRQIDASAVEPLISALKGKDWDLRLAASKVLDAVGWTPGQDETGGYYWRVKENWQRCVELGPLAVPALLSVLEDEDMRALQNQGAVLETLGQIGDVRALMALLTYLTATDKQLRAAAQKALVKIGAPAVDTLLAALKDGDREVRLAAVEALGEIGGGRAVEGLLVTLQEGEQDSSQAAATALANIGDVGAVEALLVALRASDPDRRKAAIEALGKIGDPRAVEALIDALHESNQGVSRATCTALGKIGDVRAIEALQTQLIDNDRMIRMAAAEALDAAGWKPGTNTASAYYWRDRLDFQKCIEIGAPAVDALVDALQDSSWNVRLSAIEALEQIEDPRVVEALSALSQDSLLREEALTALGRLGASGLEGLQAQLLGNDRTMRRAAAEALEAAGWKPGCDATSAYYWRDRLDFQKCVEIGAPAVDALVDGLHDGSKNVRIWAIKALGHIGDVRALEPLLLACLKDNDKDVRQSATIALGQIDKVRAVEMLQTWLKADDEEVRISAVEALDTLGWKPPNNETGAYYWREKANWQKCVQIGAPAVEALLAALKAYDEDVRKAVCKALGQIGDVRALEPLLATMKDDDSDVRLAAARALGNIGDARAVDPLLAWLKNDQEERRTAAFVLGEIGSPRPVEALIEMLEAPVFEDRQVAAKALVQIYWKQPADEACRTLVLGQRKTILSRHTDIDREPHQDRFSTCYGPSPHTDQGIGINFPL